MRNRAHRRTTLARARASPSTPRMRSELGRSSAPPSALDNTFKGSRPQPRAQQRGLSRFLSDARARRNLRSLRAARTSSPKLVRRRSRARIPYGLVGGAAIVAVAIAVVASARHPSAGATAATTTAPRCRQHRRPPTAAPARRRQSSGTSRPRSASVRGQLERGARHQPTTSSQLSQATSQPRDHCRPGRSQAVDRLTGQQVAPGRRLAAAAASPHTSPMSPTKQRRRSIPPATSPAGIRRANSPSATAPPRRPPRRRARKPTPTRSRRQTPTDVVTAAPDDATTDPGPGRPAPTPTLDRGIGGSPIARAHRPLYTVRQWQRIESRI